MNRFHILDPIPFARALRFDLEIWHWTDNASIAVDATVYWYARPGGRDDLLIGHPKTGSRTLPRWYAASKAAGSPRDHSATGSASRPAAR